MKNYTIEILEHTHQFDNMIKNKNHYIVVTNRRDPGLGGQDFSIRLNLLPSLIQSIYAEY